MKSRRNVISPTKKETASGGNPLCGSCNSEENWEQKRSDVKEYHVDTFVMGDDWKGKFDFLKEEGCEVVYLPRTPEISSSQIKEDLHTKEQQK